MFNDNHTKALRADKVSSYSRDPSSIARALGGAVMGRTVAELASFRLEKRHAA
jgi:hypothetical protein